MCIRDRFIPDPVKCHQWDKHPEQGDALAQIVDGSDPAVDLIGIWGPEGVMSGNRAASEGTTDRRCYGTLDGPLTAVCCSSIQRRRAPLASGWHSRHRQASQKAWRSVYSDSGMSQQSAIPQELQIGVRPPSSVLAVFVTPIRSLHRTIGIHERAPTAR